MDYVETWQSLRHPHVLQVFGISSLDSNPPFLISQYYPNGNANQFLAENPDADRAKIVSAIASLVVCDVRSIAGNWVCAGDAIPSWGEPSSVLPAVIKIRSY